jgi:hypothetical protein
MKRVAVPPAAVTQMDEVVVGYYVGEEPPSTNRRTHLRRPI